MTSASTTPTSPLANPFSLDRHAVLVTGAGRGLGAAMALAIVKAGATVVGVSRSAHQLATVAEMTSELPGTFIALPGDLTDPSTMTTCVDALTDVGQPTLDVVHAAGVQVRGPADQITVDDWNRVVHLNLTVPFLLSTEIARRTRRARLTGSHLFVGSLSSTIGLADLAPYAAAKSGILGVARTLAVEWARDSIRVNVLCPGYFHTELTDAVFQDATRRSWILSRIPMAATGDPVDVGASAVYFLSDATRYVTGQAISIDGGWLAS